MRWMASENDEGFCFSQKTDIILLVFLKFPEVESKYKHVSILIVMGALAKK